MRLVKPEDSAGNEAHSIQVKAKLKKKITLVCATKARFCVVKVQMLER